MLSKKLKEKIENLKKETFALFPESKTELKYENNFQLLIAIILSAQTTDKQVNKATKNLFQKLKTPQDWVIMWENKIRNYVKTLWFYKNKAKYIYQTCQILSKTPFEKYTTLEQLTLLHWVWIKTAKVFLAVTQDAPLLAVDTHVHRVLNRVWIVKTKTALETNNKAEKIFTENDNAKLHHSLIFFGRYHCTARNPKCKQCPLTKICDYYNKKN